MDDVGAFLMLLSVVAIPGIVAITLHEAAHGWMAMRLGDDTAYVLGRVTFNPLKHVDPVGTLLLPTVLAFTTGLVFGWAKPVPVDFSRLRDPRRDMVWVALAGPGVNIALAIVSALLLHLAGSLPEFVGPWFAQNLEYSILINVVLAVFNMLPLPPLDGGRVAVGLLPDALALPLSRMERFGLPILIAVLFLIPFVAGQFGYSVNILGWLIGTPVDTIVDLIVRLSGHD